MRFDSLLSKKKVVYSREDISRKPCESPCWFSHVWVLIQDPKLSIFLKRKKEITWHIVDEPWNVCPWISKLMGSNSPPRPMKEWAPSSTICVGAQEGTEPIVGTPKLWQRPWISCTHSESLSSSKETHAQIFHTTHKCQQLSQHAMRGEQGAHHHINLSGQTRGLPTMPREASQVANTSDGTYWDDGAFPTSPSQLVAPEVNGLHDCHHELACWKLGCMAGNIQPCWWALRQTNS